MIRRQTSIYRPDSRALSTRQAKQRDACASDFGGIEKAINEIEKRAESLDEIRRSAETIKGGAEKILKRTELARKGIEKQIGVIRELVLDLKVSIQEADPTSPQSETMCDA
jgi:hypothetical protein